MGQDALLTLLKYVGLSHGFEVRRGINTKQHWMFTNEYFKR